jgi:hypothetical protein
MGKALLAGKSFLAGPIQKIGGGQGVSSIREVPQCQESNACDDRSQAKRKSNPPGDLASAEIVFRVLPVVIAHTSQIRVPQAMVSAF